MTDDNKLYLPFSRNCFICGDENHAGLQTRFYVEDGKVKTKISPQDHHCGYKDVVHGGIVAAILDECMGWAAARPIERMCVTAELTVRYILAVPQDRELTVITEVEKAMRRIVYTKGEILDDDGIQYATATGKFLPLSLEETLKVDDALIYLGEELRLFDALRASQ